MTAKRHPRTRRRRLGAVWVLLCSVAGWTLAGAPLNPYAPPFGLHWGDGRAALVALAARANAPLTPVPDHEADERQAWEVRYTGEAYREVRFTFVKDRLIEVTVRYPVPGEEDFGRPLLQSLRAELEAALGPGELSESGSETNPDGWRESRRVYRWADAGRAVWLTSLELRSTDRGERRAEVLVVYTDLGLARRLELGGR